MNLVVTHVSSYDITWARNIHDFDTSYDIHVKSHELTVPFILFLFFLIKINLKFFVFKCFWGRWFRIMRFPIDPANGFFRNQNEEQIYHEIMLEWNRNAFIRFLYYYELDRVIRTSLTKEQKKIFWISSFYREILEF